MSSANICAASSAARRNWYVQSNFTHPTLNCLFNWGARHENDAVHVTKRVRNTLGRVKDTAQQPFAHRPILRNNYYSYAVYIYLTALTWPFLAPAFEKLAKAAQENEMDTLEWFRGQDQFLSRVIKKIVLMKCHCELALRNDSWLLHWCVLRHAQRDQ